MASNGMSLESLRWLCGIKMRHAQCLAPAGYRFRSKFFHLPLAVCVAALALTPISEFGFRRAAPLAPAAVSVHACAMRCGEFVLSGWWLFGFA